MMHAHIHLDGVLTSLNAWDWLVLLVLTWSTALAFYRGLARELCSLLGLLCGVLLASWYYRPLAGWLEQWVPTVSFASVLAFVLITGGVGLIAGLCGQAVRRAASTLGLGLLDRLAGGVFGFLRGSLLATIAMLVILAFGPPLPSLRASRTAPYFLSAAHGICFLVPPGLQAEIRNDVSALNHISPDWIKGRH